MASRFKTLLKRQFAGPQRQNFESASSREMHEIPGHLYRSKSQSDFTKIYEVSYLVHEDQPKSLSSMDFGTLEDILQCGICSGRLKSARMLPCQHTFCLQCLRDRVVTSSRKESSITCPVCRVKVTNSMPENLPKNLYIETVQKVVDNSCQQAGRKTGVRFAPLPEKPKTEIDSGGSRTTNCHVCKTVCAKDNRCKHCRYVFCRECWSNHIDGLKDQLKQINRQLDDVAGKFDGKIEDFRNKIDGAKESIEKDVQRRMAELSQEREERLRKTDEMVIAGEASAEEIKQRIRKVHEEICEHEAGAYDSLPDEQQKVKTFLSLQQKATELMAAFSIWEHEIQETEVGLSDTRRQFDATRTKENSTVLYKRKAFGGRTVATRDLVQRPAGLAHDPWRDNVIVTCPGSGQVAVLSKKFKLVRRIYHEEMMAPHGVVFHEETEEIIVTDKWKHCIFVFSEKGDLLNRICTKGSGQSQLRSPEGIAIHPTRNLLYVADTGNDRVQILEKDGSYRGCIGQSSKQTSRGAGRSFEDSDRRNRLNQPTDVALSATIVVVADWGNRRVRVFDHEGKTLRIFGGLTTTGNFLKTPQVVHVDKDGNILVGDAGSNRVHIFSSEGEQLRVLGAKGSSASVFGCVSGLLVMNNYEILVSDSKNNSIHLF